MKIVSVGNNDIYISNLLLVFFILLFTILVLYFAKKLLLRKKTIDKPRRLAVYQLLKYFVWVIAISLMFRAVGISLSILLAGSAALLVGIGFGLQNIFNDLICGLFILFEGTIKTGDIMEVDGIIGKVEKIHLRSTEVLSRDGMNIIVPNHKFITENVINWSYNNTFKRFEIAVGVAYDSNLELVKCVLIKCAENHPDVIVSNNNLKPMVRVAEFADNSINLALLFWSENIFRIENTKSDIRFSINKAFKENNINIPFPQRVVHINHNNL